VTRISAPLWLASAALAAVCFVAPVRADELGPAPGFSLRGVDGHMVKLSDFKGKPVVVDFWATWCGPCRATMPHLNEMQRRYESQGLVILGLSVDDAAAGDVRRFADRIGVRFRLAMADERVLDQYGPIHAIPTTFFINRRGNLVRRVVGALDAETLDGYVQELFR
jgi:thiol-disulfide isomerase/thioredoxin